MICYGRQTHWDYERALKGGRRYMGVLYEADLDRPTGYHFHFWVNRNTLLAEMKPVASSLGMNAASWSYDFLPENINE